MKVRLQVQMARSEDGQIGRWPDEIDVQLIQELTRIPTFSKAGILVNWYNVVYCQGNLVLVQGKPK
ncbi:hypothetical protein [Moorena producens]|uniref:hypothetical protein n=1 Tax=Moorena producens TaxID=1155739 RepID=UPI0011EA6FCC|nr:hypothetical protein [Moorena producens]